MEEIQNNPLDVMPEAKEISFPRVNNKGEPLDRIENILLALEQAFPDNFFHNMLSGQNEFRKGIPLSDADENYIRLFLERAYDFRGEKTISRAIALMCERKKYHPIMERIEVLNWDGVPRCETLFVKYLGAKDSPYTRAVTMLFFMGALERTYHPGCKFDTVLVFVDSQQGGGKSTMVRLLAIDDSFYTDYLRDSLNDKDIFRDLEGKWIVEMGEMLTTASKKRVEEFKAFASRTFDIYKIPYEKHTTTFPRQCVFIGTTNNLDFLPKDRTGNRRFIPLKTDKLRAEKHPLDDEEETRKYICQCWAEALKIYKTGNYSLTLDKKFDDEIAAIREYFSPEDIRRGMILNYLEQNNKDYVCTMMLYEKALNRCGVPEEFEKREINSIMNTLPGWEKISSHRFPTYGIQRGWKKKH